MPAGTLVEVFNTTLHYTPCMVDDGGFQVMVALPLAPRPAPRGCSRHAAAGDSYCYWKADKWVLCHADAPRLPRALRRPIGKNLDITVTRHRPKPPKVPVPLRWFAGGYREVPDGGCRTPCCLRILGHVARFSTHLSVH
ncbi:MAG: DUF4867 family protein [Collinsella sp.]